MEMEEIDLKDLFMYFMSKMHIIAIVTAVVLMLGMAYSCFIRTPLYKGDVTVIIVNKERIENSQLNQSDIQLSKQLTSTYKAIAKSKVVAKEVIDELDLKYSIGELQGMINVESVTDTEIIKLSVTCDDAKKATIIANKLSTVFEKQIKEIYNIENISVIDKAEVNKNAINMNFVKDSAIYFLAGFVSISAILFVIYYFDTTVKSAEEIERKLGLSVIGTIPALGKEK